MDGKRNGTAKEDIFVRLTLIQSLFALIIGAVLFCAYRVNEPLFTGLKEGYKEMMSEDYDDFDFLPYNFLKEDEKTEESTSEEKTEAEETETNDESTTANSDLSADSLSVDSELTEAVMPVNGTYTSYFGLRMHPVYGEELFHSGVDIAADEGTQILAALDGTVSETGENERSGLYVKLFNGNETETLYCHCSEIKVKEGQSVKKGEVIALVGSTGVSTGPHLHFELHIKGEAVNPEALLKTAVSVY